MRIILAAIVCFFVVIQSASASENQRAFEQAISDCDADGFDLIVGQGKSKINVMNHVNDGFLNISPLNLAVSRFLSRGTPGCLHIINSLLDLGATPMYIFYTPTTLYEGGPLDNQPIRMDSFQQYVDLLISRKILDLKHGMNLKVVNLKQTMDGIKGAGHGYFSLPQDRAHLEKIKLEFLTAKPTFLMLLSIGPLAANSEPSAAEEYVRIIRESDVNARNDLGRTALMYSVVRKHPDVTQMLLDNGADPSVKDRNGQTAIDYAMLFNNIEAAKIIKNYKPNLTTPPQADKSSEPTASQQPQPQSYAGTYSGTYNGNDDGTIQITVSQSGAATFKWHPYKAGQDFSGTGKVSQDGRAVLTGNGIDLVFSGSMDSSGSIIGTWKSDQFKISGSFRAQKGAAISSNGSGNPLGGLLNLLQGSTR